MSAHPERRNQKFLRYNQEAARETVQRLRSERVRITALPPDDSWQKRSLTEVLGSNPGKAAVREIERLAKASRHERKPPPPGTPLCAI
jgi:hypothetical protein